MCFSFKLHRCCSVYAWRPHYNRLTSVSAWTRGMTMQMQIPTFASCLGSNYPRRPLPSFLTLLSRDPFRAWTPSAERSVDNALAASLSLLSLLAAVVQLNPAFYKATLPTCAGGQLIFQPSATKQPTAEETICFLFTPTHV